MYRLSELVKLNRKLVHTQDLAILWNIQNKNTLYTTIKRYVKKGILFPVFKGLYSTVPLDMINPVELGKAIAHGYTYLSCESVLVNAGVIAQAIYGHTFVSGFSKKVKVGENTFIFRQLSKKYLFNPLGISEVNGVMLANPERAMADMLYFNSKYHVDMEDNIDWQLVNDYQKQLTYI